jgi:hypothetical protein
LFANNKCNTNGEVWIVTADVEFFGKIDLYMLSEVTDSCFILKSLEDRDKIILANIKAKFFRKFQKRKNNKSLAVLELTENGNIYFLSNKMNLREMDENSNDTIKGSIYGANNANIGKLIAIRTNLSKNNLQPIADYKQIFDRISYITSNKIYNPALAGSKKWRKFVKNGAAKSSFIVDDLEFLLLFFSNVNKVGFSHYSLTKDNVNLEQTLYEPQIEDKIVNDSIIYMRFKSLSGTIEEIDSLFNKYVGYKNTHWVIDLRNTPGGKFETAYQLADHLISKTKDIRINAGAFVCRPYYENAAFKNNRENYYTLQKNDFSNFAAKLEEKQAVRIEFVPQKTIQSKIYILTSEKTASACEPLINGLKGLTNIQIIGEKTAGKILSSSTFSLGDGFFLILPTADYLTNEWKSLENVGVKPDIKVKAKEALDYVLNKLITP